MDVGVVWVARDPVLGSLQNHPLHEITDAPHSEALLAKEELLHDKKPSTHMLATNQEQQALPQDCLRLPAAVLFTITKLSPIGTCESQ